jgi:hypothetical protein
MLFTDDVQAYSDKPSPSPFPLSFLLTMFAALTFNSITLLKLHIQQLTTTRLLSPTSFHLQQHHLAQAAYTPAYNNKVAFSNIISSSTASPCPAAFPPAYNNKVAFSYIMLIINSNTLHKLHFLQLATKRYSSLFHSSLISVAPGSTKWQNLSHFA